MLAADISEVDEVLHVLPNLDYWVHMVMYILMRFYSKGRTSAHSLSFNGFSHFAKLSMQHTRNVCSTAVYGLIL